MAETLVDKEICESCGTEVRGGSSFCYSCGESIIAEPAPPAILRPDPDLLNGGDKRGAATVAFSEPEPPPVAIPRGSLDSEPSRPTAAKTERFPAAGAAPEPRRQKPRTRIKKAAEVEWVERSSSSIGFILAAVIFAVLAVLMVVAALYLR